MLPYSGRESTKSNSTYIIFRKQLTVILYLIPIETEGMNILNYVENTHSKQWIRRSESTSANHKINSIQYIMFIISAPKPTLTRQSEMADLARRATRWVGTLSDGDVHVKFHGDRLRNGGDITY